VGWVKATACGLTGSSVINKVSPVILVVFPAIYSFSDGQVQGGPEGRRRSDSIRRERSTNRQPTAKEIRPVKKLMSIAIAFVFVTGLVGVAAAAGTTEKKPAEKMEKSDKMDKKPGAKTANGTVKSASADSIVVAGKDKGKDAEWTFAVDSTTKVKKAGKDAMASDVKAGDPVQVKYTEKDGKATAQAIMVKGAASAKKDGDKGAAKNPCAAKTETKQ
jgi:hypothetical protein